MEANAQRIEQRDVILSVVRSRFEQIELDDLMKSLDEIGLPYAPINRPQDLTSDPHLQSSGALLDVELNNSSIAQLPALPIELAGSRLGLTRNIPKIGEHTKEVLKSLGFADEEIILMQEALVTQ